MGGRIMNNRRTKTPAPQADQRPPRVHSIPVTEEDELVPDETLAEAEDEMGQNAWIDPATGELAEGGAPPRLDDD
jgi:hypothetical protein